MKGLLLLLPFLIGRFMRSYFLSGVLFPQAQTALSTGTVKVCLCWRMSLKKVFKGVSR